jgi:hypothetical protein
MSKVPSALRVGRRNCPWPQPITRLQPVSVTDKQAPPPVQRPIASGPLVGAVGLL